MSKLTELQNELKAPKGQYNKFGKYSYRSCEDVLEAVKPLLLKHDLTLVISDRVLDSSIGSYVEACAEIRDGEKVIAKVMAQAGIEKAGGMALPQAFGSASSYARKYALNGLFLIDDTKDADATNDHKAPKPITTPEKAREAISQAINEASLCDAWSRLTKELKDDEGIVKFAKLRKAEF